MIPIYDTIPSRRTPVVTWTLIAVCILVFLYELALPPDARAAFVTLFGLVPARYSHPEWAQWVGFPADDYWPFLTSVFLHGGWGHVLGNMWTLWIFGDNVEERMGGGRFLAFYLLAGVAAGAAHWWANPDSAVPTVGASGAIAGVLGAYFMLYPRAGVVVLVPILFYPLFLVLPAVTYLVFWFLLQLSSGALSGLGGGATGGVAWWAHIGGFLAGIVLHRFFVLPPHRRPPPSKPPPLPPYARRGGRRGAGGDPWRW